MTVNRKQTVHNSRFAFSVTEGEVSFKLKVSPEMAPGIVVVAYAILPSETVMAHSADISTEKCFSHKVSGRGKRMKMCLSNVAMESYTC